MSRAPGLEQPQNDLIQAETQTLYIKNLNDKLKSPDIRELLYFTFSSYGHVLDVVAKKGARMKGQAFISFDTISAAVAAKNALQDTELLGKKMKIVFSRTASNKVRELRGESLLPEKKEVKSTPGGSTEGAKKSIFNDPSQLASEQGANRAQTNGTDRPTVGSKRPADESTQDDLPAAKRPRQEEQPPAGADEEDDEGSDMEMDESDSD